MIKINVVAVGRVKEKYFAEGIAEYAKRISRFADFKITEVKEENINNPSQGDIKKILSSESINILKELKGFVVAMDIGGKKLPSEGLAELIDKVAAEKSSELTFVIGGSYGLSQEVLKKADFLLSASDMTFPHTMFRLILSEQIYRAMSILNGGSYHK